MLPRLGNGMDEELKYACCAQEGYLRAGFEDKATYDVMSEGYGLSGAAAREAFLKIKAKTPKLFVRGGGYNQGGTNTTGCVASGNVTPCEEGRSGVWLCGEGLLADCLLSRTSGLPPGRGSLPHRRARRT